jgi:hypothetical protein
MSSIFPDWMTIPFIIAGIGGPILITYYKDIKIRLQHNSHVDKTVKA